ncbi:hypothetical protein BGZ46_003709 [Entomortierella lignicola]|nr:hypothetical protein BGZ46_003709 [Entomortierella lignicola]
MATSIGSAYLAPLCSLDQTSDLLSKKRKQDFSRDCTPDGIGSQSSMPEDKSKHRYDWEQEVFLAEVLTRQLVYTVLSVKGDRDRFSAPKTTVYKQITEEFNNKFGTNLDYTQIKNKITKMRAQWKNADEFKSANNTTGGLNDSEMKAKILNEGQDTEGMPFLLHPRAYLVKILVSSAEDLQETQSDSESESGKGRDNGGRQDNDNEDHLRQDDMRQSASQDQASESVRKRHLRQPESNIINDQGLALYLELARAHMAAGKAHMKVEKAQMAILEFLHARLSH